MITIGGSDIGAILGLNPWTTPYKLWRRLMGIDPPKNDNPSMAEGRALEPLILSEYSEDNGCTVEKPPSQSREWKRWSPDAIASLQDGQKRIVEAKWTARPFIEIPPMYWLQLQWYLHHCEIEKGDLAVREPGKRTRAIPIIYDAQTMRDVLEVVEDWYERHIIHETPPEPSTAEERYSHAIERVKAGQAKAGVTIEPNDTIEAHARRLFEARAEISRLEKEIQLAEAMLLEVMVNKGAARIVSPNGWSATLVERAGAVRWKDVAEALGAKDHPELVMKHRGETSRFLRVIENNKEV